MPIDHSARAQTFRDEASRLRAAADRLDAIAAEEDGQLDVIAREAEKRRALDRALADDERREGYAFDRRRR